MTKRAIYLAAAAMTTGLAAGEAAALTPLAIDAAAAPERGSGFASEHATLRPTAFATPAADEAAFRPTLNARGPRLQCVPFARRESGVEIYGDAYTWWRQARGRYETTDTPAERSVIVMRGYANPNRGHVAVVREIVNDRVIIVDHANWLNRGEITRNVPVRDVSPRGDWSQVQVWYVPGGHWGARTYNVQGFILAPEEGAGAEVAAAAAAPVG
ncbi:MAG: CHAP domain-containing protein [Hyphomonadaceae bacterium]